jgi:hypothetical protein
MQHAWPGWTAGSCGRSRSATPPKSCPGRHQARYIAHYSSGCSSLLPLLVCFSTATAAYRKGAPFYNAWPASASATWDCMKSRPNPQNNRGLGPALRLLRRLCQFHRRCQRPSARCLSSPTRVQWRHFELFPLPFRYPKDSEDLLGLSNTNLNVCLFPKASVRIEFAALRKQRSNCRKRLAIGICFLSVFLNLK